MVGDLYRFDKKMLKSDFTEFDGINLASAKRSKDENIDSKISANKISEKSNFKNEDAKVSDLSYLGSRDVKSSNDAFNWHLRTGHMGISTLEQMKSNGWIDYNAKHLKNLPNLSCRGCLRSVNHKHVHKRRDATVRNATRPIQRNQIIHADYGAMDSRLALKYFFVMVDASTRYSWVTFTDSTDSEMTRDVIEMWYSRLPEQEKVREIRFDGASSIWGLRQYEDTTKIGCVKQYRSRSTCISYLRQGCIMVEELARRIQSKNWQDNSIRRQPRRDLHH